MKHYILWGMPASLYTAKARSYLIKRGVPFVEYGVNHPEFSERVAPAVGRFILPVVECPDGRLTQDGANIIDELDVEFGKEASAFPASGVLKTLAYLLELFGGEGLLRPAMHYRWNFDDENMAFIRNEFSSALAPVGASDEERGATFDFSSGRMRKAAVSFGVTPETFALVEQSYQEFLALFSAHLRWHPFLLGGQATIADYGFIGPLFAHLNRDPAPLRLMHQQAPAVGRWVERMNSREEKWVEHRHDPNLVSPDELPATLTALLRYIAEEYLPEIRAHVRFANEWIASRPGVLEGANGGSFKGRAIGMCAFSWRDTTIETAVMPYRFFLLQRVQDAYAAATTTEQAQLDSVLADAGLSEILSLTTTHKVARVNHLEVWV